MTTPTKEDLDNAMEHWCLLQQRVSDLEQWLSDTKAQERVAQDTAIAMAQRFYDAQGK